MVEREVGGSGWGIHVKSFKSGRARFEFCEFDFKVDSLTHHTVLSL